MSDTYNLKKLITKPTCFKNPLNPTLINLILTNRHRSLQNNKVIETGLYDHHKLNITVTRAHFLKQTPIAITYRDYKNYDHAQFRYELIVNLNNWNGCIMDCESLESVSVAILNRHAPLKKKYMRANNQPFMNKTLSKAVMNRSRLRNKFLKNPDNTNKLNYTKYRNYCTKLFRKVKKKYYNNLDIKLVVDNKTFWKTVKPLFSEKHFSNNKITLVKDDEIISTDNEVAETLNRFFTNAVSYLNIDGFKPEYCSNPELDIISNIIDKFKNHPSILNIKENVKVQSKFNFSTVTETMVRTKINALDKKKPTTYNHIPTKILVENSDIISPYITDIYNEAKSKAYIQIS